MRTKAVFAYKEPEYDPQECEITRVVVLPDAKYRHFRKNLLDQYDFISMYADEMGTWDGVAHCLLVKGANSDDGILVRSEGSGYARYSAYFPAADAYLREQERKMVQDNGNEMKRGMQL